MLANTNIQLWLVEWLCKKRAIRSSVAKARRFAFVYSNYKCTENWRPLLVVVCALYVGLKYKHFVSQPQVYDTYVRLFGNVNICNNRRRRNPHGCLYVCGDNVMYADHIYTSFSNYQDMTNDRFLHNSFFWVSFKEKNIFFWLFLLTSESNILKLIYLYFITWLRFVLKAIV